MVRVPARIVAVLVVVPLRFAWELLLAVLAPVRRLAARTGRVLDRAVRLALYALVGWPLGRLHRHVLRPVGRASAAAARAAARVLARLLARVAGQALRGLLWLLRLAAVLVRWGKRGIEAGAAGLGEVLGWLIGVLLVLPLSRLYRALLVPSARLLAAAARAGGPLAGRLLLVPLRWAVRYLLRPVGLVLAAVVDLLDRAQGWLLETLLPGLAVRLYRWVLRPLGRGVAGGLSATGRGVARLLALVRAAVPRVLRYLVVRPVLALVRYVLVPGGRAAARLAGGLWRYLLRPVLRALGWLLERLVLRPLGWLGRLVVRAWRLGGRLWRFLVLRPCRWVRREVWWPVRAEVRRAWRTTADTVRETVREVRRALLR
ncbi:hypothetical protein GCM10009760_53540 [Kitasatospora kazusensis]|uniref:Integral membrane protein n=1 Tax=Kitasatospora kazusensis TaxID=407974 RepID=A0ABP5M0P6_9ACTN